MPVEVVPFVDRCGLAEKDVRVVCVVKRLDDFNGSTTFGRVCHRGNYQIDQHPSQQLDPIGGRYRHQLEAGAVRSAPSNTASPAP